MKLSQLGEFGLINLLSKEIGKSSKEVVVGIGDDTAVLQMTNDKCQMSNEGRYLLITTDTLIENIHFKLKTTSFFDLGYKALAINISDIASMGGIPTYALVTIGANKNISVKKIEELYRGIRKLAKKFKIDIVGGDTVQSPKELVVSITLLGEVEKECMLTRAKAKIGDAILVTGAFGGLAAAKYKTPNSELRTRLLESMTIAKSKMCSSMIDSSDGLVRSVLEISKSSKVGARIWTDSVPMAKKATLEQALYGGEEYELVFTTPRSKAVELRDLIQRKTKTKVSIVGEIVAKKSGIKLVDIHGKVSLPGSGGYEHFR
ncbi:MAG: thiamine-phosphate kinase [Candidatus Margulisiibacteriota bacterium]